MADRNANTPMVATGWMMVWAVVLFGLVLVGCREKLPESAVERFSARYLELPPPVLEDSLRAVADRQGPTAVFAHYELGNLFYKAASESAQVTGWREGAAVSLLDSALVHFEKSTELDSTFVEAYVNLGSVWDDMAEQASAAAGRPTRGISNERMTKAQQMYEKALQIRPTDEKALCNLGSLLVKRRRTAEAVDHFNRALEANPKSALAHYNLAIVFAEERIYREAITEWELAAKFDPDGDIGERSRENIQIVNDLLNTTVPENLGGTGAASEH